MSGQPYQCDTCGYCVARENARGICVSPVFMKTLYWDGEILKCSAWKDGGKKPQAIKARKGAAMRYEDNAL